MSISLINKQFKCLCNCLLTANLMGSSRQINVDRRPDDGAIASSPIKYVCSSITQIMHLSHSMITVTHQMEI